MEKIKLIIFGILIFFIGNYYSLNDLKEIFFFLGEKVFPSHPNLGIVIIFISLFIIMLKIDFKTQIKKIKFKRKF